jgi:aspartate-semialdehyde dehydrogenase
MGQYTVAILGATGLVGSHLISILEERNFPVKTLKPLASKRSAGETITFRGEPITVEEATPEAFEGVDIVLASAGASISEKLAPEAVKRGAVVIDNTSFFRMMPHIPLVIAGVNDADIDGHPGVIANPNCSTSQLMPVLKALHEAAGLKRVIISTYQSVSGAGKEALQELTVQIKQDLPSIGEPFYHTVETPSAHQPENFKRDIAFNLIPQIDVFVDGDYTKEEMKLIQETRKILHLPELPITATAVRVPVLVGHSESVTVDFERPLSPEQAAEILKKVPDVIVADAREDYHTPRAIAGTDPVYVSRIRRDTSNPETGLNLWVVADNLRIGAALNAVRIAESLVARNKVAVPAGVKL